jgi:hypothetical protein
MLGTSDAMAKSVRTGVLVGIVPVECVQIGNSGVEAASLLRASSHSGV